MAVIEINSLDEIKGDMIIDFWAGWCGPCKMMGPVFEKLSQEKTHIKFGKVNVDKHPEIAEHFSIQGIPALVRTKDKEEINRIVGFLPYEQLKEKIQ